MKFDELKTPAYVIDEKKLIHNLEILKSVEEHTGCHILLAQKAFSSYALYPLISQYISGTTASGIFEAELGHECMGKENHVFAPAYKEADMQELVTICDHIIFNSFAQYEKYKDICQAKGVSVGIRVNPQCSTQEGHDIYDPCGYASRLGVTKAQFPEVLPEGIEGLHFHTLCEQNADDLVTTFQAFEEKFGKYLHCIKWLNLGGGHHITRKDYQYETLVKLIRYIRNTYHVTVYLEPGEAVALNAGYMVTEVMDIVHNDMDILILDVSAACHMPDVLEMPYLPPLLGTDETEEGGITVRLGGPTCLSGDVIGDYKFRQLPEYGDILMFGDMAIYTTCKNNTFNGMPLPDIWLRRADNTMQQLTDFGYMDFKERLGSRE